MGSFSLDKDRYIVWRGVRPLSWITVFGASTSFKDLMAHIGYTYVRWGYA